MEDHTYLAQVKDREPESSPSKKLINEAKRNRDRRRQTTRINIGVAFPKWKSLMRDKGFHSDAKVACLLLDREKEDKKNEEKKRQKEEEDRKHQEEQCLAELASQNQVLERQREDLKRQLRQTVCFPFDTKAALGVMTKAHSISLKTMIVVTAVRSTMSQAACSPSSSSGLPVISNVCSLSDPLRGKRTQPVTSTNNTQKT